MDDVEKPETDQAAEIERLEALLRERDATIRRLERRLESYERAAEEAAEASSGGTETTFHTLFDLLPDAVTIVDEDGRVLYVNRAGVELVGAHSAAEVSGRSIWDFVRDEERASMQREGLQRRGQLVDFVEQQIVRLDGAVRPIETASVPLQYLDQPAVLVAARDLTERKRAEAAQEETRNLVAKIFHASPLGISITRLDTGEILEMNAAWGRLTGFGPEEATGRNVSELDLWVDPTLRASLVEDLRRGLSREVEAQIRRKSGAVRTVLLFSQPIQVEGEACLLAIASDITERKQAESKLREAKEHAEEMARIKSTFLTNLTHEIRTPLTVILGFTSILRQGVREEYKRFVNLIERSGRRLLLMLDSMLDLAQLEAGTLQVEPRPYNLGDVIDGVVHTLRPLAEEKGLELIVRPSAERVYAQLDHAIITRVLNNMIDNAIKFTEKGRIEIGLDATDEEIRLIIRDTGIGIDQSYLPQIFEPFSQESTGLERTHQGSGLGLAVSKRLVELMGGRIEVESLKGRGSVFTIILPRAA